MKYGYFLSLIEAPIFRAGEIDPDRVAATVISDGVKRRGSYTGYNAFGVGKEVGVYEGKSISVMLFRNGQPIRPHELDGKTPYYTFDAELVEAMQAKDAVRVLFVGKAIAPYAAAWTNHFSATFDSPTAAVRTNKALAANIECATVYNAKTGRAYFDLF